MIFEKEREAEEEKNKRWVGIDKDKELTTEEKNETSFAKREFPEEEFGERLDIAVRALLPRVQALGRKNLKPRTTSRCWKGAGRHSRLRFSAKDPLSKSCQKVTSPKEL